MLKRKKAMESLFNKNQCPRCYSAKLKSWEQLTFEERIIAEKMPANVEFLIQERQKHLICPNCWFETDENKQII